MQIHNMRVQQLQVHNQMVSYKHSLGDVCGSCRVVQIAEALLLPREYSPGWHWQLHDALNSMARDKRVCLVGRCPSPWGVAGIAATFFG
jgi:hypothetical protein